VRQRILRSFAGTRRYQAPAEKITGIPIPVIAIAGKERNRIMAENHLIQIGPSQAA